MAEKVNEILEKFAELSKEEKQISQDLEKAYKEYTDYCESSEMDLANKIQEIRTKMSKLQYYIDYAREHASDGELEAATTAFETPEGTLESIRQTIKLDSKNDFNAETLYVKATGQKLYYEEKIQKTRELIEGSKVQAKRSYDSEVAALNDRRREHDEQVKKYVESEEFHNYLKMLMFDKSAFNSTGTANVPDKSFISLGQRRVKLSVPVEIEPDLSLKSNGEYNAAAHTIGAPMRLPVQKGSVLYLDYDERNQQYLFGGIQRLLLNIIKYIGHNITDCLFCEPVSNSPDCLGHISMLGKGINPFVVVPQTIEEVDLLAKEFCNKAESNPTPDTMSRIIIMHGFPEKYSASVVERCVSVFKKAEELGILVVLTHDNSVEATDAENAVRENALVIRSKNGGFWIEKLRESFFWYSPPSEIPEDIRREFVDRRRQMATQHQNGEATPAPSVQVSVQPAAPAPEPPAPPVEPVPHTETEVSEEEKSEPAAAENAEAEVSAEEVKEVDADSVSEEVSEESSFEEAEKADENDATENADVSDTDNKENIRTRELRRVFIGNALGRKPVNFEIDGDVSYICGKRCEERVQITDAIVSAVIKTTHPDDTELWAFDFGSGELMNYAQGDVAHFRFLVADSSAETAVDVLDSLDRELEYRINWFNENGWKNYSDVEGDKYLPRIVVIVNEFPKMLSLLKKSAKFGRNYISKLNGVFKYCGNYGIHFVLIGESFSENGKYPECFKNCTIRSAAALNSSDLAIGELFSSFSLREGELSSLRRIPAGSAYVAVQGFGGALARFASEPIGEGVVYTPINDYTPDNDTYTDKYPLIVNRRFLPVYEDRHTERGYYIEQRSDGETLLFLGEPCRLEAEYPVHLYNDFGENVLALVPAREKTNGLSVVFAVISSLCEQGVPVEILAFRSNPVYSEMLRIGAAEGIQIFEGDTALGRIREISAEIAEGRHTNSFEIVLGGDNLYTAMSADENLANLNKALIKGPTVGTHFMFVTSGLAPFSSDILSVFKHKVVFPCAMRDAEKLLNDPEVELAENAFRLSGEGDEVTVMPYII